MEILILGLIVAALLPYLAKIPVAYAMHQLNGYDNKHPREQQTRLTGFGARALAAHYNAFESLLIFAIAVLAALATNNTSELIAQLVIVHIVMRVCYHLFYLFNFDVLRSISWLFGIGASFAIIALCLPY